MNDLLGFPVTYNQTMLSPTNVVVYSNSSIRLSKNIHLILQQQSSNPQPGIYIQISALFEVYEILSYSQFFNLQLQLFYHLGSVVSIQIHVDRVNCFSQSHIHRQIITLFNLFQNQPDNATLQPT